MMFSMEAIDETWQTRTIYVSVVPRNTLVERHKQRAI